MGIVFGGLVVVYALMWIGSLKTYPTDFGISFSPEYARSLGLDAQETFDAILEDLKPTTVRLAVPWNKVEPEQGVFDYAEVDRLLEKAGTAGSKVVLTVGQKVPRWPECYIPTWAAALPKEEQEQQLLNYVATTINRYKDNPAIELWQAENEAFINFPFGECDAFDRDSVTKEIALIRQLDPTRQIVTTDSGELSTYRVASREGDILGTTLYRTTRVSGGFIVRYDWLPPAFYKLKARLWGNDYEHFFVSELQAEPWFEGGMPSTLEGFMKEKTFSPERFRENIAYAHRVGASRVYLWGAEWWYFMKTKIGDSRYWEVAEELFQ